MFLYLPWRIKEVIAELLTEALQRPLLYLETKQWSVTFHEEISVQVLIQDSIKIIDVLFPYLF